ncbi:HAD-IB family hydrolase [Nocardioides sp. dk4132]|uniref:HAD-IB family hydrolase n=1 Tax=unclassified Nocardioides TaxID=2615069 RepID=UPI0012956AD7|nr:MULTISPECIES: HAD-IB family hydrolase [unclassified Nocardioides]MQW77889.1 HAD-IB family hydrolase [Nocardioides sp. dk4132]QGA08274.1 HAD-IB family hydrolase [Nocardioides sp. dk884]
MPTSLADRLDARHVLLTGVTGFVGEALLHLLLSEAPGCRTTVLVRARGAQGAADRIAELLGKAIFAPVVEAAGGVERLMASRVAVLEGNLAQAPALPDGLDGVVHCAGDVSFDPPVDQGFATNVVGTRDLLARIDEALARERRSPEAIHYVHVSTAYVAGRRRGHVAEGPVEHDVDLEAELAWGLAERADVERRSRGAEHLTRERRRAEKEHGRAGLLTAARATEAARREWVQEELARVGSERARSLGWTDCYTFTKALGERVVEGWARTHRASIVRPSIIESALARPHPGWIEGFKMAEPLILAYGRGELPEFPAAADTIVDIVPVDHVVAALVAVLAHPPAPGAPAYFHVTSGDRNPLAFAALYVHVRGYFEQHPFTTGDRGAARLPEWRFPGAPAVERLLTSSERAHRAAGYVLGHAPRGDRTRDLARRLDQQGRRLAFLRRYLDLYREYAQAELRFSDAHTLALWSSLSAEDRERFAFDTAAIDWAVYLRDIHCPAVTAPVRAMDELRAARGPRTAGVAREVGEHPGTAAFFDMDGTLLSSNVIETYLWMRLRELTPGARFAELARIAAKVPTLVQADRRQRSDFLRTLYREYAGARLTDLEQVVDEQLAGHVVSRLSPDAVRRIRQHRAAGQRTVLITGAIAPLTRPLAPLFDHIEAAELAVDERGVCTGHLAGSPLVGESRAAFLRSWAAAHDVDLAQSFAYADSHSDLPLLAAVGNPVAVRPDVALFRHARRHRWTVVDWASPPAAGRALNPAGGGAR